MSAQLEIVEAQALSLAPEERAQLADRLITSLFDDQGIEAAWAVEVERRVKNIESGRAQLIPAAEAIARARAAIPQLPLLESAYRPPMAKRQAPLPDSTVSLQHHLLHPER